MSNIEKNVNDAVSMLISEIKKSAVYIEYKENLSEVNQYPDLKKQIDEFRTRNFELQNSADCAFDKLEQLEKEYEDFRENPLVSDFLAAELAFCRMMQDINNQITEAVQFD